MSELKVARVVAHSISPACLCFCLGRTSKDNHGSVMHSMHACSFNELLQHAQHNGTVQSPSQQARPCQSTYQACRNSIGLLSVGPRPHQTRISSQNSGLAGLCRYAENPLTYFLVAPMTAIDLHQIKPQHTDQAPSQQDDSSNATEHNTSTHNTNTAQQHSRDTHNTHDTHDTHNIHTIITTTTDDDTNTDTRHRHQHDTARQRHQRHQSREDIAIYNLLQAKAKKPKTTTTENHNNDYNDMNDTQPHHKHRRITQQVNSEPESPDGQIALPNLNVQVDQQHQIRRSCKAIPSDKRPIDLEPPTKVARQKLDLSNTDKTIARLTQQSSTR